MNLLFQKPGSMTQCFPKLLINSPTSSLYENKNENNLLIQILTPLKVFRGLGDTQLIK